MTILIVDPGSSEIRFGEAGQMQPTTLANYKHDTLSSILLAVNQFSSATPVSLVIALNTMNIADTEHLIRSLLKQQKIEKIAAFHSGVAALALKHRSTGTVLDGGHAGARLQQFARFALVSERAFDSVGVLENGVHRDADVNYFSLKVVAELREANAFIFENADVICGGVFEAAGRGDGRFAVFQGLQELLMSRELDKRWICRDSDVRAVLERFV